MKLRLSGKVRNFEPPNLPITSKYFNFSTMSNPFYSNNRSNTRRNPYGHQKHSMRPLKPSMNFTDNFSDFSVRNFNLSCLLTFALILKSILV